MLGGDSADVLSESLPNITGELAGTYGGYITQNATGKGALYIMGNRGTADFPDGPAARNYFGFDASRCSPIYQNDCNTVQPPSIVLIPQIKF